MKKLLENLQIIISESFSLTSTLFITEKKAAKKAEIKARKIAFK